MCGCYGRYVCTAHRRRDQHHDFERDNVTGYDPVNDGFAYPDAPATILTQDPSCTCTVKPPSHLLVETDTERAFRAARVELCDNCVGRLTAR